MLILQGSEDPVVRPNLTEDFVNKIQPAALLYVLTVKMKELKDDENFDIIQSEDDGDDIKVLMDYPTE